VFDEPFSSLDSEQRATLAKLIAQRQKSKAIIVSLNSKADLDLLNPTWHRTLDEVVISDRPFIRLVFKLKPSSELEVRDFISNFLDTLVSKKGRGVPLSKS